MKRAVIVVLDSLGIGALKDAADYGDAGTNTLRSIIRSKKEIRIPNLIDLGLCNIDGTGGMEKNPSPMENSRRPSPISSGLSKTTTG